MFIWVLLIAVFVLVVAAYIFFKIRTPKEKHHEIPLSSPAQSLFQNLPAKDFLPIVIELKEKSPYDWAKIINTLNPQSNDIIQRILIDLKNKELSTAKVVLEKFIRLANENPNQSLQNILNNISDESRNYGKTESVFNDEERK